MLCILGKEQLCSIHIENVKFNRPDKPTTCVHKTHQLSFSTVQSYSCHMKKQFRKRPTEWLDGWTELWLTLPSLKPWLNISFLHRCLGPLSGKGEKLRYLEGTWSRRTALLLCRAFWGGLGIWSPVEVFQAQLRWDLKAVSELAPGIICPIWPGNAFGAWGRDWGKDEGHMGNHA